MKEYNGLDESDVIFYSPNVYEDHSIEHEQNFNEIQFPIEGSSGDVLLPNIFVTIPGNNSFFGNAGHQENGRLIPETREDIKYETIKSESNELNTSSQSTAVKPTFSSISAYNPPKSVKLISISSLITARPKASRKYYKCKRCLFMTLSEDHFYIHVENCEFDNELLNQSKLLCPGCENVFYHKPSFESHLKHDHKMIEAEIISLLEGLSNNPHASQDSTNCTTNSNRGFINLFDILQKSNQEEHLNNNNLNQVTIEPIVIASDKESVEREPCTAFLESNSGHSAIEVDTTFLDLNTQTCVDTPQEILTFNVDMPCDTNFGQKSIVETGNITVSTTPDSCYDAHFTESEEDNTYTMPEPELKQVKSPKIYIKNDDILKKPASEALTNVADSNFLPPFNINEFNFVSPPPPPPPTEVVFNTVSQGKEINNLVNIPKKSMNSLHLRTVDELNLLNMKDFLTPNPVITSVDLVADENMDSADNSQIDSDFDIMDIEMHDGPSTAEATTQNHDYFQNYEENSIQKEKENNLPIKANNNWLDTDTDTDTDMVQVVDLKSPPRNFLGKTMTNFDADLNTPQRILPEENESDQLYISGQDKTPDFGSWGFYSVENDTAHVENDCEKNGDGQIVDISDDIETSQENCAQEATPSPVPERGRIYVADNLLKSSTSNAVENDKEQTAASKTKSKHIITKLRKLYANIDPDEKKHKCEFECGNRFQDMEKLDYHKKCHVGSSPKQMQCPECLTNTFRVWDSLHTHLWQKHQVDMELYSCSYCNFKTPMLTRLINTHVKIHSEEKNFKCETCNKLFKNNRQLKNHRRVHRKVRKVHKCVICYATFSQTSALQEHNRRLHAPVLEFRCPNCSEIFNEKEELKKHQTEKHKNTAKYDCHECGYKTNDRSAFRRHSMIHVAGKKYSCPYCDYKCIQSNVYRRHVSKIHPERENEVILKCQHCNFTTINKLNFETHIARHTGSSAIQNVPEPSSMSVYEPRGENDTASVVQIQNVNVTNIAPTISVDLTSNETFEKSKDTELVNKIKVRSNLVLTDPNKINNSSLFFLKMI